jgi:hypothetical protein
LPQVRLVEVAQPSPVGSRATRKQRGGPACRRSWLPTFPNNARVNRAPLMAGRGPLDGLATIRPFETLSERATIRTGSVLISARVSDADVHKPRPWARWATVRVTDDQPGAGTGPPLLVERPSAPRGSSAACPSCTLHTRPCRWSISPLLRHAGGLPWCRATPSVRLALGKRQWNYPAMPPPRSLF